VRRRVRDPDARFGEGEKRLQFPFLRMVGPPTSRVVWPSSGRRLANPRPYFLKIKVNFRTVHVEIGTVLDVDWTKYGEIVGQYLMTILTEKFEF
jgi:hypothetical protein